MKLSTRWLTMAPLIAIVISVSSPASGGEQSVAQMRDALRAKFIQGIKAGKDVRLSVPIAGMKVRALVKATSDAGLEVDAGGNAYSIPWADVNDQVLYSAAGQVVDETDGEGLMLLAKFAIASGWADRAEAALYRVQETNPFLSGEAETLLAKLKGIEKPKTEKAPAVVKKPIAPKPVQPTAVPPGPEKVELLTFTGKQAAKAPDWADAEFQLLAGGEEAMGAFLDKYLEASGCLCVHVDNAGTADDIVEGIATWDRQIILHAGDRVRKAYLLIWKNEYQQLCQVGNGFKSGYYSGGYDAEHASELLQMLWGCMDVFPEDKELIEQNKKVADAILRGIEPKTGLFKSDFLNNSGGAMGPGHGNKTSSQDFVYMNALFQEYIRSGDPKYRTAILRFGEAVNRIAERNSGIIPCVMHTDGSLPPDWWKGSFDYTEYGVPGVSSRGWTAYTSIAAFLSGGDARILRGFRSTISVLFDKGGGKVPALKFDGKTWEAGNNWEVMPVIERLYDLCWDDEAANWVKLFGSGYGKYFYFGSGGTGQPASTFRERATWMKQQGEKIRSSNKVAKTGDDLAAISPDFYYGYHYIDGTWWSMGWDNGRCGGAVNPPVRYFREDGTTGLPDKVAAVVTHVERYGFDIQLYNDDDKPVKMWLTGGFYGTHRIETIKVGEETKTVGSPRMLIEIPAKTEVAFQVAMLRYAYRPNAYPWKYRGLPAETFPQNRALNLMLGIPF